MFYFLIIIFTLLIGTINSYNITVISGVLLFLQNDFDLSLFQKGSITGFLLLGTMVGALFSGTLTERYGRKSALILSTMLVMGGGLLSVIASKIEYLIFGRCIIGLGIGVTSVVLPMYLSEVAPAKHRGKLVTVFQLAITMGSLLAYVINWLLRDLQSWRIAFLLSTCSMVVVFILAFFIKESPVWLFNRGREEEAKKIWLSLRSEEEINQSIFQLTEQKQAPKTSFKDLFQAGYRKQLSIGIILGCFQQFTGINAIIYYAPMIFLRSGFEEVGILLLATLFMGLVNSIATVLALNLIDKLGRKNLLRIGLIGMIGALFSLALFPLQGIYSIIGVIIYVFSFAISLGPSFVLIVSEIFPSQIRSRGMSFVILTSWFSNFLLASTFLIIMEAIGIKGSFLVFGVISILALTYINFFLPETKGKTLEEIQQEFDE